MIRAIISFLASVFTAVQAVFLYVGKKGLCVNDGCEIVDSMTSIPPFYFNIAGFVFFQTLFWLFVLGRVGNEYWHKLARLLLLAGLVAEAVLVFFQHSIARVYCSYCLVIFAVIVLLNLFCGLRQFFRGVVLFAAVLAACFSVRFTFPPDGKGAGIDAGSMAVLNGSRKGISLYLFFSSSCSHCEKVIADIGADNICTVRFNPIDTIKHLPLSDVVLLPDYDTQVNRSLLQDLSIKEIPVLMVVEDGETRFLKGGERIGDYLEGSCRRSRIIDYGAMSNNTSTTFNYLPKTQTPGEDACSVNTDCESAVSPISKSQ